MDDPTTDPPSATDTGSALPDCATFVGQPVAAVLKPLNANGTVQCSIPDATGAGQDVSVNDAGKCTNGHEAFEFVVVTGDGTDSYLGTSKGLLRKEDPGTSDALQTACGKFAPAPVTYQITSDGGIGIVTYSAESGIAQDSAVPGTSWTKNLTSEPTFLSVSAQNAGTGNITCQILREGQVIATNTAHGAYAIADCTAG